MKTENLRSALVELELYIEDFEDSLAYGEQARQNKETLKLAYKELEALEND
jgi:hypothetical protein